MFNRKVLNFIFIFSTFTPDSSTYTAGVVEFTGVYTGAPESALKENMKGYQDVVKNYIKPDDEVDIIVFPEFTLNIEETATFINDPKEKSIPCDQTKSNQDILTQLSCLAKEYKKYMVFNIVEKENCTVEGQMQKNDRRPCARNGLSYYNTNVVFDRNGSLIARYRKWNLYDNAIINTTITSEFVTFKTDFGVEFALIICFDLTWWTPTMELVKQGYKNFIHPMYWYSELPFLTASQIHMGYAYAANINLLSAGSNYASDGATGSAVYLGRNGPAVSKMTSKPTAEILIAKVPKTIMNQEDAIANNQIQPKYSTIPERLFGLTLDRDITLDTYRNFLLKPDVLVVNEIICHNKFCCKFTIVRKPFQNVSNKTHYSYRLVAFSGPRKYNNSPKVKWMKTCAIIACTDDKSINSCGRVFDDKVQYWNTHYFKSIVITAKFLNQEKRLIMPNTIDAMMKPMMPVNAFEFRTVDIGKSTQTIMSLKEPVSDLITFGIFADYYDGFQETSDGKFSLWYYIRSILRQIF